tara:strand:- start:1901 stop:2659 length:759 start_codon:yes stop_codon:yes gene_type:complete
VTVPESLSDFDLAPLSRIDPSLLMANRRNRVDQLFLALALVFNDLKGMSWFHLQLAQRPAEDAEAISGYNGQRTGMLIQSIRMIAGIIHELLELLRKFEDTLKDSEVRRVLGTVDVVARKQWRELVALANGKEGKSSELAKALMRVRHVTFHYYNPAALAVGYEDHFLSGRADPASAAAYFSDGETMERTRFYYADAAAHRMLEGMGGLSGGRDPAKAVAETARIVNEAIKPILIEFIRQRRKAARGKGTGT